MCVYVWLHPECAGIEFFKRLVVKKICFPIQQSPLCASHSSIWNALQFQQKTQKYSRLTNVMEAQDNMLYEYIYTWDDILAPEHAFLPCNVIQLLYCVQLKHHRKARRYFFEWWRMWKSARYATLQKFLWRIILVCLGWCWLISCFYY